MKAKIIAAGVNNASIFLVLLSLLVGTSLPAQNLMDFQWFNKDYSDDLYLGFTLSHLSLTNDDAPNPDNHNISGFVFEIQLKKVNYEKGEPSRYFRNKLLGDVVSYYSRFGRDGIYQKESSSLSTGLLGWWSWVWNINKPGRFSVAAGFNLNDFSVTSSYVKNDSLHYNRITNQVRYEPQGYYYSAGPSLRAIYMLNSRLQLEYFGSFSVPFVRLTLEDFENQNDSYPNPHFMNHYLEIVTSYGLFAGYEYTGMINRGDIPNETKRSEWYLGFRIRL